MNLILLLFYFLAAKNVEVQMAEPQLQAVPLEAIPEIEILPAAPMKPAERAPKIERLPQLKVVPAVPIKPAAKAKPAK